MRRFPSIVAAALILSTVASPALAGTTYRFLVSCEDGAGVAQWNTGSAPQYGANAHSEHPGSVSRHEPSTSARSRSPPKMAS